MSKHYVRDNFLSLTLALGDDQVVSVLWRFCDIALDLKKNILPEDAKSADRLMTAVDSIVKKNSSKSLKEKAEKTLKELKTSEISKGKDEDEEARVEREKEILKKEKRELEEAKKTNGSNPEVKQQQIFVKPDSKGRPAFMVQGASIKKQFTLPPSSNPSVTSQPKLRTAETMKLSVKSTSMITKPENLSQTKVSIMGTEKQLHHKTTASKKKR